MIGVRESRMIDGVYTLTVTDLKDCVHFEDGIAACNYDIDIHNPEGTGTSHYYFKESTYYTIPYRSLMPKNIKNLLAAGPLHFPAVTGHRHHSVLCPRVAARVKPPVLRLTLPRRNTPISRKRT